MKWRCALAVAFGLLAVLLGPAGPASAHATVVSTAPGQGTVLGASPAAATLTFSEPIRLVPDKIVVVAPDGKRINTGAPTVNGTTLTIPLRTADRPLGSYLVSYRVISADNHPVAGTYVFSVGARSAITTTGTETGVDPAVRTALPVTRYLGYTGVILLIGPVLMLAALWPRRLSRQGAIRLVGAGFGLVGFATVAALWLQAPYTSGGAMFDVSARELGEVLSTPFGVLMAVRLAILVAIALLLRPVLRGGGSRARRGALALLALAGLSTWPLSGHPGAGPVPVAGVIADTVHLAAAALWVGGLVVLAVFLLRRAHERALGVILPVWSKWAMAAVCYLALTGAVQAFIEVGTLRGLTGSDYGRLVLAKIGLLVIVVGVAMYSRRLVQRRLVAAPQRKLRRAVSAEVAITALVLAASAVLVQTTPGRSDTDAIAPASADGFAETLNTSLYTLQFDIYPVQLGEYNTLHAFVYTPDGKPLPVAEWKVTTSLPSGGIEPIDNPILIGTTPNHGIGALTFPVPGDWQVRFTIRVSEIDQATVVATVPVSGKQPAR
jgi:copper transport protein